MTNYMTLLFSAVKKHWLAFTGISVGFVVIYYGVLLLLTMIRFAEIPNYIVFHDIIGIYGLILEGTPSMSDAFMIAKDEAWIETGYKNPEYYGVATWSYMLIPPKMFLVFLMGLLLATFTVLILASREQGCALKSGNKLYATAGVSTTFVSLTSATLTWVVCCATPSWVVALAMLGMNASLALWLEPLGQLLMSAGLGLMLVVILYQLKQLALTKKHNNFVNV